MLRFKGAGRATVLYPLLLLLCGTFGATSLMAPNNRLSYAAFLLILVGFGARIVTHRRSLKTQRLSPEPYDYVPLVMLLVWLYGLVLGLAEHNHNVSRNFAGMTLYSLYYVFLFSGVGRFDLLRCVLAGAAINATYMFGFYVFDKVFRGMIDYGPPDFRLLAVRSYYSESLILLLVPALLSAYALLRHKTAGTEGEERRTRWRTATVYVYIFAFLQISLSKATLLAYFLAASVIVVAFWRDLRVLFQARQFVALALAGTLALSFYPTLCVVAPYLPASWQQHSRLLRARNGGLDELSARSIRRTQNRAIAEEFSFGGKGLGATLASGYSRDESGYGFEQNYLNLMHKFGVFSFAIFFMYLLIGRRIIAKIADRRFTLFALSSISVFAGFIMGIGNPILMSPIMVTLQCVILYWLRDGHAVSIETSTSAGRHVGAVAVH